jgi:hypothetical protein
MAAVPELNAEHKRWISNLERDYPDLPMGYARAMTELYLSKPELFDKENIDRWAETPVPKQEVVPGHMSVMSPEDAVAIQERIDEFELARDIPAGDNVSA